MKMHATDVNASPRRTRGRWDVVEGTVRYGSGRPTSLGCSRPGADGARRADRDRGG